jgi:DNA-binding response OmpR family regulator
MDQMATIDPVAEPDIAEPVPQPPPCAPFIAIVEQGEAVSAEFRHVFDYLGIRMDRIGSVEELRGILRAGPPMAVIWQVAAGLDSGEVLHALSDADRTLPVMMIAEDNSRTLALLDSMVRFWRMLGVMKLARPPHLREVVEFIFRAGRRSGEFRVLSV